MSIRKNYVDYQQLRRTHPDKYYLTSTQEEMYHDAIALGHSSFYAVPYSNISTFNSEVDRRYANQE